MRAVQEGRGQVCSQKDRWVQGRREGGKKWEKLLCVCVSIRTAYLTAPPVAAGVCYKNSHCEVLPRYFFTFLAISQKGSIPGGGSSALLKQQHHPSPQRQIGGSRRVLLFCFFLLPLLLSSRSVFHLHPLCMRAKSTFLTQVHENITADTVTPRGVGV